VLTYASFEIFRLTDIEQNGKSRKNCIQVSYEEILPAPRKDVWLISTSFIGGMSKPEITTPSTS
jgi:hypothetical protein